ncbi:hypothetical protein AB1K83_17655, partial [Sporosarcina sp. 179-K 3D1 HS]|uniref:hypothetical protein n=1 Tax=Sporosarcina sp. 179-K 3D1 HS TaxID=3232169 RepID=UPI0039A33E89
LCGHESQTRKPSSWGWLCPTRLSCPLLHVKLRANELQNQYDQAYLRHQEELENIEREFTQD